MKRIISLSGILLTGALLFACASKNMPEEKLAAPGISNHQATDIAGKETWKAEWEKTIAEAKKENSLTVHIFQGPVVSRPLANAFKNKYGISAEFFSSSGLEVAERVSREKKAGILTVDLMISGPGTMLSMLKPAAFLDFIEPELILPELTDPALVAKTWYDGKLAFLDKDKQVLNLAYSPAGGAIGINTDLVAKDEIKSARDLLNPKWKEKIVMMDPILPGSGSAMLIVIGEGPLGYDYARKLAEQKPVIIRDRRLVAEWVARGKYAITIGAPPDQMLEFQRAGSPIIFMVLPEARFLSEVGSSLALLKDAPHPKTRRLFTNWLLSREGMTAFSQASVRQSSRIDVPTDHLTPEEIREPGANYFVFTEEYKLGEAQKREILGEIFKQALP